MPTPVLLARVELPDRDREHDKAKREDNPGLEHGGHVPAEPRHARVERGARLSLMSRWLKTSRRIGSTA